MSPPHLLAADGMPATPALHAPLAFPYAHATPAVTPAGGGGSMAFASPMTPGTLAPPMPGVHAQLSRLELDAMQLSRQYEAMLFSLQDSQKHMSAMTLHYVASLQQAVKVRSMAHTNERAGFSEQGAACHVIAGAHPSLRVSCSCLSVCM